MRLPSFNAVTFPYGATSAPYSPSNPHAGTDYGWSPDPFGYAVEPLIITRVGELGTAGLSIDAKSLDGSRTYRYCHASELYVSTGQQVGEGHKLHRMGETGLAFGIHLHFVTWLNGNRIDGDQYIRSQTNQGGSDMINDKDVDLIRIGTSEIEGRDFQKTHSGAYDTEEMNYWVNKPIREFIQNKWQVGESYRVQRLAQDQTIADLNKQLELVTKQRNDAIEAKAEAEKKTAELQVENTTLKAENQKLTTENAELKALTEAQAKRIAELEANAGGDVTINFNFIGVILWRIVKTFGLKK